MCPAARRDRRRLAAAQRPLIWAGGGAGAAGGPLPELPERLGAPLLTSNAGRGAVSEDHALGIGNFAASAAGQPLLADADLLLSIGTHFRSNETADYALRLPERTCRSTSTRPRPAAGIRRQAGSPATPSSCSGRCSATCPRTGPLEPGWLDRGVATRRAARDHLHTALGWHRRSCRAIRSSLSDPARRSPRTWRSPPSRSGNRLLPSVDPATDVFARGGGRGKGLAMGIGGALARPDSPQWCSPATPGWPSASGSSRPSPRSGHGSSSSSSTTGARGAAQHPGRPHGAAVGSRPVHPRLRGDGPRHGHAAAHAPSCATQAISPARSPRRWQPGSRACWRST